MVYTTKDIDANGSAELKAMVLLITGGYRPGIPIKEGKKDDAVSNNKH